MREFVVQVGKQKQKEINSKAHKKNFKTVCGFSAHNSCVEQIPPPATCKLETLPLHGITVRRRKTIIIKNLIIIIKF